MNGFSSVDDDGGALGGLFLGQGAETGLDQQISVIRGHAHLAGGRGSRFVRPQRRRLVVVVVVGDGVVVVVPGGQSHGFGQFVGGDGGRGRAGDFGFGGNGGRRLTLTLGDLAEAADGRIHLVHVAGGQRIIDAALEGSATDAAAAAAGTRGGGSDGDDGSRRRRGAQTGPHHDALAFAVAETGRVQFVIALAIPRAVGVGGAPAARLGTNTATPRHLHLEGEG